MTTRSGCRTLAVLLVAACAVVGCSGNDNRVAAKSSPTNVTVASVDPARVSPTDLVTAPELDHPEGAIRDVTFSHCAVEPGKQKVHATIRNSTAAPRDYVVTVSWVNTTSDVLARGIATEKGVKPSSPVTLTLDVDVPKGVAECTFHVDAGTLP